jgi:hypothetical protein
MLDHQRSSNDLKSTAEISNQVDQSPILTIPDELMRDHSSLPVHEPLSTVVNDSKSRPSGCPLSRFIPQENSDLEDSKGNQENNPISSAKINQPTPTITNTNTNPYGFLSDLFNSSSPIGGFPPKNGARDLWYCNSD